MKLVLKFILFFCVIYTAYLATHGEDDLPPLQNGDLIFETTWTNQTFATIVASNNLYTHTGIVQETEGGPVVIEAGKTVQKVLLHDFIERGILGRFAVYRYKDLTPEQGDAVVAAAVKYYGRPYDFYFYEGDGSIYCSELDYLSFKNAGLSLGHMEKIRDLNINNHFVKQLIKERWQGYPQCRGKNVTFDQCYEIILDGSLVTPGNIASDPHLTRIFTNYP